MDSALQQLLDDAVLPATVHQDRQAFQYVATGKRRNIFDAFDPAEREHGGMPIDPTAAYNWAAGREDVVAKCHKPGLLPTDKAWPWFETEVRKRIFADSDLHRLLTLIDRFSFAKTGPERDPVIGSMAWNYPDHAADFAVRRPTPFL